MNSKLRCVPALSLWLLSLAPFCRSFSSYFQDLAHAEVEVDGFFAEDFVRGVGSEDQAPNGNPPPTQNPPAAEDSFAIGGEAHAPQSDETRTDLEKQLGELGAGQKSGNNRRRHAERLSLEAARQRRLFPGRFKKSTKGTQSSQNIGQDEPSAASSQEQ